MFRLCIVLLCVAACTSEAWSLPIPERALRRRFEIDGGFETIYESDTKIRYRRSVDYGLTDIEVDGVRQYLCDLLEVHYWGKKSEWFIERLENDLYVDIDVEK